MTEFGRPMGCRCGARPHRPRRPHRLRPV